MLKLSEMTAYRLLGVPTAFRAVLQPSLQPPASMVSKIGKAVRFLLLPWSVQTQANPAASVVPSLAYLAPPAVSAVLTLTRVRGVSFGPMLLDALG